MTPREELELKSRVRDLESQSTDFLIGLIIGAVIIGSYLLANYIGLTH